MPLPLERRHDHPAIEFPGFHVAEHLVDVFELHLVVMGMNLPFAGELDRFLEVLAAAHNRSAYRDAAENNLENGGWNSPGGRPTRATVPLRRTIWIAWWKAGSDGAVTSAPCVPPPVCLTTCAGASDSSALTVTSAPDARASSSFSSLTSTAATCKPIALAYSMASWPRPPTPEMSDPLAWLRFGLLDALVGGNAGAKYRRHGREARIIGQPSDIRGRPNHVLGKAAIDVVAVLRWWQQRASHPVRQYSHQPQASCSQATPTGSPSLNQVTPGPTAAMTPTPS